MSAPDRISRTYRFALFEADSRSGKLFKQGRQVRLQGQPFQLLMILLEDPGQVVTREEIRQRLWPGDTFVEFDKSLGVAVTKLRDALDDAAASPRFIETIPKRGYRFIASIETDALVLPPSKVVPEPETPSTIAPTHRWNSLAILVISSCVLAAAAVTVYAFHRLRPKSLHAAPIASVMAIPPIRRSIAVLGFRDLQGRPENAWLSAALSEMLSTELASTSECRLIPGEDVASAERDLPLADQDTLSRTTLLRLRTNPGADVVVLGSYAVLSENGQERLRLDLRMQDTASGETISEQALTGNEENLFELAADAGTRMRQALGISTASTERADPSRISLPSNQLAFRLYTEGRVKLWAFDFPAARDLLIKAVAADPDYPLAHSALSQVWGHLDYGSKARVEAQRALELSQNLPQEERLVVEGQYRTTIQDWPKAIEAYQSLFERFPDNLDYGLQLAGTQIRVSPADARQTLATLRHLPFPADEDARIDLLEASAWIDTDFARARAAAESAISKGKAQGSILIVARAYGILCQQASSTATSSTSGIRYCQQALQRANITGGPLNEARTLNDFAGIYFERGDIKRAETMWRQANQKFHQNDDPQGVAATLNNIGDAVLAQGDLKQAQKFLAESIPNYRAVGDKDGVALALNDEAEISRLRGDLEAAGITYQQAQAAAQAVGSKSTQAYVLSGLGDVLRDRGDLPAARKSYQQALALRNQTGEKQAGAESQVALARLSIEEGHAADAETVLRKCAAQFHQAQESDDELTAAAALIETLLAQNNESSAKNEAERFNLMATKSQNRLVRVQFDVASAHVALASDRPESSRIRFSQIQKTAHDHGLVAFEFEARLALAELDKKSGRLHESQAQAASLENAARQKGFGLIAREAAALR